MSRKYEYLQVGRNGNLFLYFRPYKHLKFAVTYCCLPSNSCHISHALCKAAVGWKNNIHAHWEFWILIRPRVIKHETLLSWDIQAKINSERRCLELKVLMKDTQSHLNKFSSCSLEKRYKKHIKLFGHICWFWLIYNIYTIGHTLIPLVSKSCRGCSFCFYVLYILKVKCAELIQIWSIIYLL